MFTATTQSCGDSRDTEAGVTSLVNTLILPPLPHMFDKVLMEICYGDLLLRVDITRNAIIAVGI